MNFTSGFTKAFFLYRFLEFYFFYLFWNVYVLSLRLRNAKKTLRQAGTQAICENESRNIEETFCLFAWSTLFLTVLVINRGNDWKLLYMFPTKGEASTYSENNLMHWDDSDYIWSSTRLKYSYDVTVSNPRFPWLILLYVTRSWYSHSDTRIDNNRAALHTSTR